MTRVIPKTRKQEHQERLSDLEAFKHQVAAESEDEVYTPDGKFSFFRDMAAVAIAESRLHENITAGSQSFSLPLVGEVDGDPREAAERLATAQDRSLYETRALSAAGAGGTFVPTGIPAYLADLFALAARDRAVLPNVLP